MAVGFDAFGNAHVRSSKLKMNESPEPRKFRELPQLKRTKIGKKRTQKIPPVHFPLFFVFLCYYVTNFRESEK